TPRSTSFSYQAPRGVEIAAPTRPEGGRGGAGRFAPFRWYPRTFRHFTEMVDADAYTRGRRGRPLRRVHGMRRQRGGHGGRHGGPGGERREGERDDERIDVEADEGQAGQGGGAEVSIPRGRPTVGRAGWGRISDSGRRGVMARLRPGRAGWLVLGLASAA